MDNKFIRGGLIGGLAVIVLLGMFSGGFLVGHFLPIGGDSLTTLTETIEPPPTVSPEQQTSTPEELQTLFQPFWEAWNIVHEEYVDQPVDDLTLMQGAIRGMMDALGDEHSSYMDPKTYEDANAGLAGEYEGIGAWVDTTADYLTIISPIPGSPADRVGLKPGDKIVALDGEDMTGLDPELVRQRVLGPAGSTVVISVEREGADEALDFTITREKIVIDSATGEMLENDIGYVQITTFGDKTTRELRATLEELMAQDPQGLVIDLRNNGGGFLQTSVEVASEFIGEGVVLYEQYGDGKRTTYQALENGQATEIPLVVLINEGTASASEIVAGAIQDYDRGQLVGATSFGKGSVQNWVPLSNDQGAVRVTIAKWLTPNERTIAGEGLQPDVEVEITDEDRQAEIDPQLDKAIALLSDATQKATSSPEDETSTLPAFPETDSTLEYDDESKSLSTKNGQIVYSLDEATNRWVPYIPRTISKNLPEDYELVEISDSWAIQSQSIENLYTWNVDSLTWQLIAEAAPLDAPEETVETFNCPLAPPSKLSVEQSVLVATNLNLRSSPGIGDNWLRSVPPGTKADVVGGPDCIAYADGAHVWWQVKLADGTIGWMAESSLKADTYFLEPIE